MYVNIKQVFDRVIICAPCERVYNLEAILINFIHKNL